MLGVRRPAASSYLRRGTGSVVAASSPQQVAGPGFVLLGLLLAFAGFVMLKHSERTGQQNEHRNIRMFGPRIGPRVHGAAWQVRQAGWAFLVIGLLVALAAALRW